MLLTSAYPQDDRALQRAFHLAMDPLNCVYRKSRASVSQIPKPLCPWNSLTAAVVVVFRKLVLLCDSWTGLQVLWGALSVLNQACRRRRVDFLPSRPLRYFRSPHFPGEWSRSRSREVQRKQA